MGCEGGLGSVPVCSLGGDGAALRGSAGASVGRLRLWEEALGSVTSAAGVGIAVGGGGAEGTTAAAAFRASRSDSRKWSAVMGVAEFTPHTQTLPTRKQWAQPCFRSTFPLHFDFVSRHPSHARLFRFPVRLSSPFLWLAGARRDAVPEERGDFLDPFRRVAVRVALGASWAFVVATSKHKDDRNQYAAQTDNGFWLESRAHRLEARRMPPPCWRRRLEP